MPSKTPCPNPYGEFFSSEENAPECRFSRKWTEEEIYSEVARILVEVGGLDKDEVTPEARLVGDLGFE